MRQKLFSENKIRPMSSNCVFFALGHLLQKTSTHDKPGTSPKSLEKVISLSKLASDLFLASGLSRVDTFRDKLVRAFLQNVFSSVFFTFKRIYAPRKADPRLRRLHWKIPFIHRTPKPNRWPTAQKMNNFLKTNPIWLKLQEPTELGELSPNSILPSPNDAF